MKTAITKAKQDEYYANTQLQTLVHHSFAVGYLSRRLFLQVVDGELM
ncbi:MAG: hypothetical protein Q4A69_06085 [Moraxella sp.]|nr:hypothetical protein [Moraxella sp.]